MRVWMLCEAFTFTGDALSHQTVHESLTLWSLPCGSRKTAMGLKKTWQKDSKEVET